VKRASRPSSLENLGFFVPGLFACILCGQAVSILAEAVACLPLIAAANLPSDTLKKLHSVTRLAVKA
jgi:hypothetical protein